jgi:glutamine amidotransferase
LIVIVDYGMGNLHSVSKAVERLGYDVKVSGNEAEVMAADGVILPGVGAFGDAMAHLRETGLDVVMQSVATSGKPLLGICLGMQLLFDESEEHGLHEGLHLLPGRVVRFQGDYKVPHMGWNQLQFRGHHPLLDGIEQGYVYFVHSYHAQVERTADLLAITEYYQPVTSIVGHGTVFGMQFHPEKSGAVGLQLLERFLKLC